MEVRCVMVKVVKAEVDHEIDGVVTLIATLLLLTDPLGVKPVEEMTTMLSVLEGVLRGGCWEDVVLAPEMGLSSVLPGLEPVLSGGLGMYGG